MAILRGSQGNDVLTGGNGNDIIEGGWGDDTLNGGDGDDLITDTGGSTTVNAGSGDDFIRLINEGNGASVYRDVVRTNVVDAGAGNDVVELTPLDPQKLTVDLGSGADLLVIDGVFPNMTGLITTGEGSDRIKLTSLAGDMLRYTLSDGITITDFTAGDGGDILDLGDALQMLIGPGTAIHNYFADGHLILKQDGADTLVVWDMDGLAPNGTPAEFETRTLFRLANVQAASLVAFNFAGIDPQGSLLRPATHAGGDGNDWLAADAGGSTLRGMGGNDRLYGSSSDDRLEGGAGNDWIRGGFGNDVLLGGDGDDDLSDAGGSDLIDGGNGNDLIVINRARSDPATGPLTLNGGAGDDVVRVAAPKATPLFVDLGDGNDRFEIAKVVNETRLTLGAGQDRVVFGQLYLYGVEQPQTMIITDFAAGNGGDILELDRLVYTSQGWDGVSNPFASGHLFLQQDGADTLVKWDYDGNGPTQYISEIVRLLNVNAATLTAFNFTGFAPSGTASTITLPVPTAGDDVLWGSFGDDRIDGGDGNDVIVEDRGGNDTLLGGAGDDSIKVVRPGNGVVQHISIDAGAGNDTVNLATSYGTLDVNLGAGNDRLLVRFLPDGATTVSLGSGVDTIELTSDFATSALGNLIITDFQTGPGGDRLDWVNFVELKTIHGEPGFNPFFGEEATLVQSGSDVQLILLTSAGSTYATFPLTIVTFKNHLVSDFTDENLGYWGILPSIAGTIGNDVLVGTTADDVIAGSAGDDRLDGLAGADVLRGGAGNDILFGGDGNDFLRGQDGDDTLVGGSGDDNLDGGRGADLIYGGDGNDRISDYLGSDTIDGGSGDDRIDLVFAFDGTLGSLRAGDGNDFVSLTNIYFRTGYTIDLGAGDDTIALSRTVGDLTLGTGRDTILFNAPYRFQTLTVTDFEAGVGGDVLDVVALLTYPLGWAGQRGPNPFAEGYLELKQVGDNVELLFFREAIPYPAERQRMVVFQNTQLSQFTAANFGGYDPHVVPNRPTLVGADLVIASGTEQLATNVTAVWGMRAGLFIEDGLSPTVTNHGTIRTIVNVAFGTAAGLLARLDWANPSFVNASDGRLLVQSDLSGASGIWGHISVRNDGLIDVSSRDGVATGHESDARLVNNGTINVSAGTDAYGVFAYGGTDFVNSGTITVQGGETAYGVLTRNQNFVSFDNSGTITATTGPNGLYASVGIVVQVFSPIGANLTFTNSGTITGDIGLYVDELVDNSAGLVSLRFTNSGTINGDTFFGSGADTLLNSGTLANDSWLGSGDDLYDGSLGLHFGSVYGEDGNDRLVGGAFEDWLSGGRGDDRLIGGGGADRLWGDQGDDALSGGAGADILSGGEGADIFRDTAAFLNGDTISDFDARDRIIISDANLATFSFSLVGNRLTFTGGSLLLGTLPTAPLIASAAVGGGVQLATFRNAALASDFNGDGRSDVLLQSSTGALSVWRGQAGGVLSDAGNLNANALDASWKVAGIGDFNGDGRDDILWRHNSGVIGEWTGQFGVFQNNSGVAANPVDNSWRVVGVADYNGDGRDDILWRHSSGEIGQWLSNPNGSFANNGGAAANLVDPSWTVMASGDFNGDGQADILWRHTSGVYAEWQGSGTGKLNNVGGVLGGASGSVVGSGDFNGDGRDDIIMRDASSGALSVWLGQANGQFSSTIPTAQVADLNWKIAAIGDYNGDGRDDLIWKHTSGVTGEWLGQSNGDFINNGASLIVATGSAVQSPDVWLV